MYYENPYSHFGATHSPKSIFKHVKTVRIRGINLGATRSPKIFLKIMLIFIQLIQYGTAITSMHHCLGAWYILASTVSSIFKIPRTTHFEAGTI